MDQKSAKENASQLTIEYVLIVGITYNSYTGEIMNLKTVKFILHAQMFSCDSLVC